MLDVVIKNQIIADYDQGLMTVNFYDCNFVSNMRVDKVGYALGFYNYLNIDLDVFVYNVCELFGSWTKDNGKCSFL